MRGYYTIRVRPFYENNSYMNLNMCKAIKRKTKASTITITYESINSIIRRQQCKYFPFIEVVCALLVNIMEFSTIIDSLRSLVFVQLHDLFCGIFMPSSMSYLCHFSFLSRLAADAAGSLSFLATFRRLNTTQNCYTTQPVNRFYIKHISNWHMSLAVGENATEKFHRPTVNLI